MHEHHKSSLLLVENQHWRRGMPQKYLLFGLGKVRISGEILLG